MESDILSNLQQGTKFETHGKKYMVVPEHCECYGHTFNCIDLRTGTAVSLKSDTVVDIIEETEEE